MIASRFLRPALFIVLTSAVLGMMVSWYGVNSILSGLEAAQNTMQANLVTSAVVLLVWSFLLFLTVLPFGTATILIAGALLGPWVGWVQFAALVCSGLLIFKTGFVGADVAARAELDENSIVNRILIRLEERGIAATMILRLAPFVPAAVCSLVCTGLSIRVEKFMVGTLIAGWVRPVFFGYIGAAADIGELWQRFSLAG